MILLCCVRPLSLTRYSLLHYLEIQSTPNNDVKIKCFEIENKFRCVSVLGSCGVYMRFIHTQRMELDLHAEKAAWHNENPTAKISPFHSYKHTLTHLHSLIRTTEAMNVYK